MEIQANNLKRQFELFSDEYKKKICDILDSGRYILGDEVYQFENEFSAYIGTKYCVGLASGLDALEIAFKIIGIKKNDEVIVCSNAYIACVMGITKNGGIPIFVEPDIYDNIDADKIEEKITSNTKAILAVHLYGQSCDMNKIMNIAKKYKIKVIEDCAQAHGTKYNNQMCGSFGDIACFSFYPTKGLGAFGDGGAITTNNEAYLERAKILRNYGSKKRYEFEEVGFNSRLDEIQAGLLRVKLKHLDELNKERNEIANYYSKNIKNKLIKILDTRPNVYNTWHQYVIHCKERDNLIKYLNSKGIGNIIHYPIPPHLSKAYKYLGYKKGDFKIAEQYANEVLSIPMYNGITKKEQDYIIDALNNFKNE